MVYDKFRFGVHKALTYSKCERFGWRQNLHEGQNNSCEQNIHHETYNNIPKDDKFAYSLNLIGENQNVKHII